MQLTKTYTNLITLFIITALVFLVIGIKIGNIQSSSKVANYEEILDYYAPIPEEVYVVDGEITSVSKDSLVLKVPALDEHLLPDKEAKMVDYKIMLDENTKITRTEVNLDPAKTKTITLTIAELKVGDMVGVKSKENAVSSTELTAVLIDLTIYPKLD